MKTVLMVLMAGLLIHSASAADTRTTVPLSLSGAAAFHVEVNIKGVGSRSLLVDTGAGYTAINREILATLKSKGLARHVREIEGVLADGTHLDMPVYRISQINIGGACELHDIEAAVFPGATRGLLGLNALSKTAPFVFSMKPPSLQLSHCRVAKTHI